MNILICLVIEAYVTFLIILDHQQSPWMISVNTVNFIINQNAFDLFVFNKNLKAQKSNQTLETRKRKKIGKISWSEIS